MAIAASIKKLLESHHISYRIHSHPRTTSARQTAELMGLNGEHVLQVQLLADSLGTVMAVFPLNARLDYQLLKKQLHRNLKVLPDCKANRVFKDCEARSHPPFGEPYNLSVLIDKRIGLAEWVYVEAGSHTSLIELLAEDYLYLNNKAIRLPLARIEPVLKVAHKPTQEPAVGLALQAHKFPPLPPKTARMLGMLASSNTAVAEFIGIVEDDALIVKALIDFSRLPIFHDVGGGRLQEIVKDVLGFEKACSLAIAMDVLRSFGSHNTVSDQVASHWMHALLVGLFVEHIIVVGNWPQQLDPKLGFTCGLFHNIGMLLMGKLFPPEYQLLHKWMQVNPDVPIQVLERRLLGMGAAMDIVRGGHAQLGGSLLEFWQFPKIICQVAANHHRQKVQGRVGEYVTMIQLANQILRGRGIGDGEDRPLEPEDLSGSQFTESQLQQAAGRLISAVDGMQEKSLLTTE